VIRVFAVFMMLLFPMSIFASIGTTVFPLISAYDEDEEDEEEEEEKEEEENAEEEGENESDESDSSDESDLSDDEKKSDEFSDEKKSEEFSDEKKSDEFTGDAPNDEGANDFSSQVTPQAEEDFVMEKRSDEVLSFKKPDVVKLSRPSYMYVEPSLTSKKMFELYKNDEMEIFEKNGDFYRARFLGKEGWVQEKDVIINKWHSYRIYLDLTGGIAWGGGDIKNASVMGNYNLAVHVSLFDFMSIGAQFKSFSVARDAFFLGGGLQLRYLVHGIRTKNSRFALTFGGGYLSFMEKPGDSMVISENMTMQGYYIEGALDYIYRVWEWIHLGIGGDVTYYSLWGNTPTEKINRGGAQGGVHLKVIINLYR
jgi:hypothetical protein